MSTPKKGDRVRITFDAEYRLASKFFPGIHVVGIEGIGRPDSIFIPVDATIEVLPPLDRPIERDE